MRKAQKELAENLTELLDRVHEEIKKAAELKNVELCLRLLEKCQEAAIRLGTLIEEAEGEGTVTVSLLEEYCELVYRIHQDVCGGQLALPKEVYRNLHEALISVRDSIQKDISVRLAAVFLPYKASQWDSLESVFKAAEKDLDCDVYVIPIPYYYKNPDGSFREMHYEGDQFPEDVPITRYDEFDFGKHQPDIIFINNPYDEYNHAISVLPFFYSSNLKKYTQHLIYIPYFTIDEINYNDERAFENMKYYAAMPGVVNADKVIVQSETMRKAYISFLVKEAGEHTREVWEEKIWGLGSPKEDKFLPTERDNLKIQEDWLKVFKKQDGSWKKVVLYNTNVSVFLSGQEQMMKKMRNILGIFQENQEEIALIWHSHPLIQKTLQVLDSKLGQEYEGIVREYCEGRWGIYDDSDDINWAAALCDAYYGDGGSTAVLFQKLGKPVLIQDVKQLNFKQERREIK